MAYQAKRTNLGKNLARDGAGKNTPVAEPGYGMKRQTTGDTFNMFQGAKPLDDEPLTGNLHPTVEKRLTPVIPTAGSQAHGDNWDGTTGRHVEGQGQAVLDSGGNLSSADKGPHDIHGDHVKSKTGGKL